MQHSPVRTRLPARLAAILFAVVVVGLWALHWVHLGADFPNNSPWMDYSKYTDEGWYGKAAIHAILFGSWYVPGDLNTAVALPVWPALEWLVFKVTGVGPYAARGLALVVFGGNLAISYALLRAARANRLAAGGAVLLLAGSMYLWAFSRLAILEPLLSFWILGGWLLALWLKTERGPAQGRQRTLLLLSIGVLGCLAVLTKTTALFLLPGTASLLCWAADWKLKRALRDGSVALLGGLVPWLAYYLLVARRYSADYHYFFAANKWEQPKGLYNHVLAYWWAAHGLLWIGPWLVCTALVLLAAGVVASRPFRRLPLLHASLLAVAGYIFFTGWHNNPQPRYYMVLAYPVVFTVVLATEALARRSKWVMVAAVAMLTVVFTRDVNASAWFARHPEYTLQTAATGLTAYVDAHPEDGRRMLLSISGDEITLLTHLPAICDDFGTDDLPTRIDRYRPGWYAQWNELDPGTLEDIHSAGYRLKAVAHWHAFDDEDRDDLVLYRMEPQQLSEVKR